MVKTEKLIFIFNVVFLLSILNGCWFDEETTKMRELEKKIKQGGAVFRDYRSLGEIYYKKERHEDTIECMTSLLAKYNNSSNFIQNAFRSDADTAYRYRGKAFYLLGRKEDAAKDFAKGDYESYGYYQLGELYFKKKKYTEVIECMDIVIENNENEKNYGAHSYRGRALYLLGEKEAGTEDLFKAGGWPHDLAFMREHGIEWVGKERDEFDRQVRQMSDYNSRTGKNFKGRDRIFNALRDDINNSNMS